ncbi:MAG: DegQ family serine endoprotease [Aquincola sp.]|nr:DegQ family serine endoprotease [Aquincola sp.]MDH5329900.1 DegQ family serine endoprotease [Aquincola sp.]
MTTRLCTAPIRSRGLHALTAVLFAVATPLATLVPAPAVAQAARELPDFTELVERVGPAVVNIRTSERLRASASGPSAEMDEQMREFFRRFGIPVPEGRTPPRRGGPPQEDNEPQQRGVGSGFILTADGYVMTNAHVVDGADEVIVTLTDKREFKAKIIGADRRTDVAVVKIEAAGLPTVKVGDINQVKVGAWVMAIGAPFGLDNTVTAGIVSAKQRDTGDFLPMIQTDVAINPGNSGGPLINMRGEVIGINSQIYSRSGGFMGISFAIPIDEAMRVSDQLRANGRVIRGRIGVTIAPVTKEVAEAIGLGAPRGALVQGVEDGLPAAKAGVEPGDIIVKVDGKAVEKSGDLPRLIGATKPGAKTSLQLFRRGQLKDVSVTVVEFEADRPRRVAQNSEPQPAPQPKTAIGLAVSDLTDAQKKELKLRGGVKVESVEGAAARAGVREGDVILTLDNVEVTDAKQFSAQVSKLDKTKPVSVMVRRGDWTNYMVIRPAPR